MREHARGPDGLPAPLKRVELAKLLGVSPANITQIENGASPETEHNSRRPDLERIQTWARACGYTAMISFQPENDTEQEAHPALQLTHLTPEHRQLVQLLAELCPEVPPILLSELQVRLEAWRVHLPRWQAQSLSNKT